MKRTLLFVVFFSLLAGSNLFAQCAGGPPCPAIPEDQTVQVGPIQIPLAGWSGTAPYSAINLACSPALPGVSIRDDVPGHFPPDTNSGLIGVVTNPGTYVCTYTLRDNAGHMNPMGRINLHAFSMYETSEWVLPDASVGVDYSFRFKLAGTNSSTIGYALTNPYPILPPGLTLNPATGEITGVPTTAGTYDFWINFRDGAHVGTSGIDFFEFVKGFRITVLPLHFETPVNLPAGTQNVAYDQQLVVSGGVPPYTFSTDWLPAGLTLSSFGRLSGVPQYRDHYGISITVSDSGDGTARRDFALGVDSSPASLPTISEPYFFQDLMLGEFVSQDVRAFGGKAPYSWSIVSGSLPPGISIRSIADLPWGRRTANLNIAGIPVQTGEYNFTIEVTDSSTPAVSTRRSYTWKVSTLWLDRDIPAAMYDSPYSHQIRVLGGGNPANYQFSLAGGRFPKGLTMNSKGVVSGTPEETGWFWPRLAITNGSNSLTYWIGFNVATVTNSPMSIDDIYDNIWRIQLGQPAQMGLWVRGASGPISCSISSGSLPPGISLLPCDSLPSWAPPGGVAFSGTPTTAGTFEFSVRVEDTADPSCFAVRSFRMQVSALSYTGLGEFPTNHVGTSFSQTLSLNGAAGAVTWAVRSDSMPLPSGLTLSPNGTISGTPSVAGNFWVTLLATDTANGQTFPQQILITIYPVGMNPPLNILDGPDLGFHFFGPRYFELRASGGQPPYTFSLAPGALAIPGFRVQSGPPLPNWFPATTPAGLLGVAVTPGNFSTTVRVTDHAGQTFDKEIRFSILPIVSTTLDLPEGSLNEPYNGKIAAAGGTPPYAFAVAPWSNPLPPGLSMSSDGTISGTPTASGQYWFSVRITDSSAPAQFVDFPHYIYVGEMRLVTSRIPPNGVANVPYSHQIEVSGGIGPYTFSLAPNNQLPANLSLSPSGLISGTPTYPCDAAFELHVSDSVGHTLRRTMGFSIVSNTPAALQFDINSNLGEVVLGVNFGANLYASGGVAPYSYQLEPGSILPAGLELKKVLEISSTWWAPQFSSVVGRPITLGSHSFTLRVTDSLGNTATRTLTMVVRPLLLTSDYLPTVNNNPIVTGNSISIPLLAVGGTAPYTWSGSNLPEGMALSASGTLAGTPVDTGWTNFPVTVADSAGNLINWHVWFLVQSGTSATLNLNYGQDLGTVSTGTFTLTMRADGSPLSSPDYSYSLTSGSQLPPGMGMFTGAAIPNDCCGNQLMLAGNLTTPGNYKFFLRVTDAAGNIGARTFYLHVIPRMESTDYYSLMPGGVGVPYVQQLHSQGGIAPISWAVEPGSGVLPPGLVLSSSGLISGSPTVPGNYSFVLRLTDAAGNSISASHQISISTLYITNAAMLPTATVGAPFTVTFTATGPGSPYVWSLDYLPDGLSLDPSSGVLSGTLTYSYGGNWPLSVTVGNAAGTAFFTKTFYLPNYAAEETRLVSISTQAVLPDAQLGNSYWNQLYSYGGTPPLTWSLVSGALPPGISLVSGSALPYGSDPGMTMLMGVPASAGLYSFVLRVSDAKGISTTRTFSLRVMQLSLVTSDIGAFRLGDTVVRQMVATGGLAPYHFTLSSGDLPLGLQLNETGLISGTTASTGNYYLYVRVTDSVGVTFITGLSIRISATSNRTIRFSRNQSVDAPVGIFNSLYINPYGGTRPYSITVESGSSLPPGLELMEISSNSIRIVGIPNAPGDYSFNLRAVDSLGNFGVEPFRLHVTPLNITTSDTLPNGHTGQSYYASLEAVNGTGAYRFVLSPDSYLPAGLSLNLNGIFSGNPTESGQFYLLVLLSDANGYTLSRYFSLTIYPSSVTIPLFAAPYGYNLPGASVNDYMVFELDTIITSGNAPYKWALAAGSSLPPGIDLIPGGSGSSDLLTGIPTAKGNYSFSLQITDAAAQSITVSIYLIVSPIVLSPDNLPAGTVNSPYSVNLTASGGTSPYHFSLLLYSSMPVGLSLNPSGVLSGTPQTAGTFPVYIGITDAVGNQFNQIYSLRVSSAGSPTTTIQASPSSLVISYMQGGPPPAPAYVIISSTGGPIPINASASSLGWLQLLSTSSSTPGTAMLSFNPAGLAPKTYNGVLTLKSTGSDPTQYIPITFIVTASVPCSYSLSPSNTTVSAAGETGSFTVTCPSGCSWAAASTSPWISFTNGGSSTGTGLLNYSVLPNSSSASRQGTIDVGGQIFTLTQFGQAPSISFSPASIPVPATGGSGKVQITASNGSVSWIISKSVPWISVIGGSGQGSGTLNFNVQPNPNPASRVGYIMINGQQFAVNQQAYGCTCSLYSSYDSRYGSISSFGQMIMINISPSSQGCDWTIDNLPSWMVVANVSNSGGRIVSAGTTYYNGSGNVNLNILPNSSIQKRSATIQIGGKAFQINQEASPCSFTLGANNLVQPASGGQDYVDIQCSGGCPWVASSNANWLIVSTPSGYGPQRSYYYTNSNPGTASRTATLSIAGQNIQITQNGTACSYNLQSTSAIVEAAGGAVSLGVVAAAGCPWTAISNATWLQVSTGATGSGSGQVSIVAQANPGGNPERSGTVTIAGLTFGITQKSAGCAYALVSPSGNISEAGGQGTFTYTALAGCTAATVQSYANWITILSNTFSGTAGTVTYSASQNIAGVARSGNIIVGSNSYKLNQTAAVCNYQLESASAVFYRMGGSGAANFTLTSGTSTPCTPIVGLVPGLGEGLTLRSLAGTAPNYNQNYSVDLYQTFMYWARTLQINIGGQLFTVKQYSFDP